MTDKTKEALKLALDAICGSGDFLFNWHECEPNNEREMQRYQETLEANEKAFNAIREALAEHPAIKQDLTPEQPAPVQQGWLPMETAPKDGTDVLVWIDVATVPVVHLAWFNSEDDWIKYVEASGSDTPLEEYVGWWTYPVGSVSQEKLDGHRTPLFWMPYIVPSTENKPASRIHTFPADVVQKCQSGLEDALKKHGINVAIAIARATGEQS